VLEAVDVEDDWDVWVNLEDCYCPAVKSEVAVALWLKTRYSEQHNKSI
jgi:hypothetical protein